MIWTETQDRKLRALFDRGMSASEIAVKFGTTRNAVIGRKFRIGHKGGRKPRRRYSASEHVKLRRLYLDGMLVREIAKTIGRSVSAVTTQISILRLANRYDCERRAA